MLLKQMFGYSYLRKTYFTNKRYQHSQLLQVSKPFLTVLLAIGIGTLEEDIGKVLEPGYTQGLFSNYVTRRGGWVSALFVMLRDTK